MVSPSVTRKTALRLRSQSMRHSPISQGTGLKFLDYVTDDVSQWWGTILTVPNCRRHNRGHEEPKHAEHEGKVTEVTFELCGFSELEKRLACIATVMTANLFFPNGNYPPLRSNVIRIVRVPTAPVPIYAAHVLFELITVNCAENRPWQYTQQVAHEFGHLSTRADKRYPRQDGNMWIEEAICGAYSIYAIRAMSEAEGPLKVGAHYYLYNCLNDYRSDEVDADWFARHLPEFRTAATLTMPLMKLSGYIAARLPVGQVIADNRAIMDNPLNEDHRAYLSDWKKRCNGPLTIPALLESLGKHAP
jgi:hypothetical protein